jgi:hypothetical protein
MRRRKNSRLRAARTMAGFRSARAAALAHSWPESLYAAHETGSRRPSPEQEKAYFAAFGVDPAALDNLEKFGDFDDPRRILRRSEKRQREIAGRRLGLARRLAGYKAAHEATSDYGWKEQSYYAHESGRHAMSEAVATTYGIAYGVSPAWLLRGDRPSRLSHLEKIDDLAEEFVARFDDRLPDELLAIVSPSRRGSRHDVEALKKQKAPPIVLPKATNAAGDVVDVVREAADRQAGMAWGFPEGFLGHVWGITSTNLRMVPLTPAPDRPDVSLGDRALVDCDAGSEEPGAAFAVRTESGDISVVRDRAPQKGENILGRIVARISRTTGN